MQVMSGGCDGDGCWLGWAGCALQMAGDREEVRGEMKTEAANHERGHTEILPEGTGSTDNTTQQTTSYWRSGPIQSHGYQQ